MKFTPEVVAALKVLRDNAESDFERHRIDVLERDLTAPPTVEVVDENHQRFNSITYRKQSNGRYATTKHIHRDVWQYWHGEIPDEHAIHHLDRNPTNNTAENLQCLSAIEHSKLHLPKKQQIPQQKSTLVCKQCGQEYSTVKRKNSAFCSRQCRDKFRYRNDVEKRICKFCGQQFEAFRYNKNQFCSPQCHYQFTIQQNLETRICPCCGKSFEARKTLKKKYCSKACAIRAQHERRKT